MKCGGSSWRTPARIAGNPRCNAEAIVNGKLWRNAHNRILLPLSALCSALSHPGLRRLLAAGARDSVEPMPSHTPPSLTSVGGHVLGTASGTDAEQARTAAGDSRPSMNHSVIASERQRRHHDPAGSHRCDSSPWQGSAIVPACMIMRTQVSTCVRGLGFRRHTWARTQARTLECASCTHMDVCSGGQVTPRHVHL